LVDYSEILDGSGYYPDEKIQNRKIVLFFHKKLKVSL